MEQLTIAFLLTLVWMQYCSCTVNVEVKILSYSNVNGTAYVTGSQDRKCCDGPQRPNCTTGDTCDTYFDICIGSFDNRRGCTGAFFKTKPFNNTNVITSPVTLADISLASWHRGMSLTVFVRDDDSNGMMQVHDQIDSLQDTINFFPQSGKNNVLPNLFHWQGKASLKLSVSAWCTDDYYGQTCDIHCVGLPPMALCEGYTGALTCQPAGELLLEFKKAVNQSEFPDLIFAVNKFVQDNVCRPQYGGTSSHTPVYYPQLYDKSRTMTFTVECGDQQLTALQFESILQLQSQQALTGYFTPGVVTGPRISIRGYGEHTKSNMYIGIELLELNNPDGMSYVGPAINGKRRCCDVPRTSDCSTAKDKCDMQASVCIGAIKEGVCIGSVSVFNAFQDSLSIETCGPALLDNTNNVAYAAHPMVGGMKFAQNPITIVVFLNDVDMEGNSSDVIDILSTNVTVVPGANVTSAKSVDVSMKNLASLTLRLLFWCTDGHSGPYCDADNGTDTCDPGWYGDECQIPFDACHPNPCKHNGVCNITHDPSNPFRCQCPFAYTGASCEQDVNECTMNICYHNATCENTMGAFKCHCTSFWDGLLCRDSRLPACDPNPCSNGRCFPVSGLDHSTGDTDYKCICNEGYSGSNCNERTSCATCNHGDCRNINGIDTCVCHFGFGGTECSADINECDASPCLHGSTCHNSYGNFSCECPDGYSGSVCEKETGSCRGHVCFNNGTCLDIGQGAYLCMCTHDYTGDKCDQLVDHCQNIVCANNGTCISGFGDFTCNCTKGWSGKICDVDVNECSKSACTNFQSVNCTNTKGSYRCGCQDGWTGQNCETDINECTDPAQTACVNGQCTNIPGAFSCICNPPYTGQHCDTKIEFCLLGNPCSMHGLCYEKPTGHCDCYPGYGGSECRDIDECQTGVCGPHVANCTNTDGSYNCTCNSGWTGANCTDDLNECSSTKVIPCSGNGICTNSVGSYKCSCFPGFSGADCETFVDTCQNQVCHHNGTCILKNTETRCSCPPSWTGISCEDDVNECENVLACNTHGDCQNVDGSFYCRCFYGWTGSTCNSDVNECTGQVCENDGVCSNTRGSYTCACHTGRGGHSCEVQLSNSTVGNKVRFKFQKNITNEAIPLIVSYTNTFLKQYVCNGKAPTYTGEDFSGGMFEVIANCGGLVLTQTILDDALKSVPNDTRPHLFPLPLQSLQLVSPLTTTTSQSPETQSWVEKNWHLLAGVGGGLVFCMIVLVIVLIVRRRSKAGGGDSFENPGYSSDQNEMMRYDTIS